MAKNQKVKIQKEMKSPKALATKLLGGKGKADSQKATALAKKIKNLNPKKITQKGQTLKAGMVLKVGKKKTKKFGELVDLPGKYVFLDSTPAYIPKSSSSKDSEGSARRNAKQPVKIADPDIINFNDDLMDIDIMSDLIFEGIGGHEIINIVRNDLINGQPAIYRPIKNLDALSIQYNSTNLLASESSSNSIFDGFGIFFEEKLPLPGLNELGEEVINLGTGPNGEIIYLEDNGDLVVNVANLNIDEVLEIDVINSLELFNDTIYVEDES
jgi:hypothetical protein